MYYFNTLPKIIYLNPITNSPIILTNILVRSSIIKSILDNPILYYEYNIVDGDTPDIVASKYYGDSYRYWIVMLSNQYLDPQWNWPLTGDQFNDYIVDKYNFPYDPNNTNTSIDPYSTVYEYQLITSQYDVNTMTETTNTTIIDEATYNLLPRYSSVTYTLPTGPVTVTTTTDALSLYNYEQNLNESKRSIKLLDKTYANEIESELKKLMAA